MTAAGLVARRIAAVVIDIVFVIAVLFAVSLASGQLNQDAVETVLGMLLLFGAPAYLVVSEAITGRTLGKRLVGLRVVGTDRRGIGIGRALLRLPARLLAFTVVGFVWALWDDEQRTWHDRLTATRVVHDTDVPAADDAARAGTPQPEGSADLAFWPYYRDELRWGVPIGTVVVVGLLWLEGLSPGELVAVSAVVAVVGVPFILLPRAWSRWWRDRRDHRALAEATVAAEEEPGADEGIVGDPDVKVGAVGTVDALPTGTVRVGARVESGIVVDYDRGGVLRKAAITAAFALFGLLFALAPEVLADTPGEVPFLRGLGMFIIVVFTWVTIGKVVAAVRGWFIALTPTELIHGLRGRPTRIAWGDVVDTDVFAKHGNALLGVQLTDRATIHAPWTTRIASWNRSLFTRWDLVIPLEDLTVPTPQLVEAINQRVQRVEVTRSPPSS